MRLRVLHRHAGGSSLIAMSRCRLVMARLRAPRSSSHRDGCSVAAPFWPAVAAAAVRFGLDVEASSSLSVAAAVMLLAECDPPCAPKACGWWAL